MQLPGSLSYACAYQFLAGSLALFLVSNECKYQCRIFPLSLQMSMINVLASFLLFFIATMVVHGSGDNTPRLIPEARGCFEDKQANSLFTAKDILSLTTFA